MTLANILRPVRTFCNFTRHFIGPIILHHIVHKALYRTDTLANILRPVRTFCNVN
ncbi:unnamed protein product [Clavelina lepadiformis]|uniref:Uncharacterized protein n=1 Tax=Clavelina lepadiformis TaxID=159417 RepID=A0ABP0G749_CLALP